MLCTLLCLLEHDSVEFSTAADHQFTEAVEGYTKAIALNPTNAVYYANRAAAHIHLENFGFALADASKAIELDPKYTKVYLPAVPDPLQRALMS